MPFKGESMKPSYFYIDKKSPAAYISVFFMCAAAIIRIVYYSRTPASDFEIWMYLVNVVAAAIIFAVCVLAWGDKRPELTTLPVLMGVVFFMVKAFTFPSRVHTVLCLCLYAGVLVIYSLTVLGVIKIKELLYALFGLPLLYHIFVEDMKLYVFANPRVPFFEWLPEISVLSIMAALLSISFAMKKRHA